MRAQHLAQIRLTEKHSEMPNMPSNILVKLLQHRPIKQMPPGAMSQTSRHTSLSCAMHVWNILYIYIYVGINAATVLHAVTIPASKKRKSMSGHHIHQ